MQLITHGGNLHDAASQYGIPLSEWTDLSTGIAPRSWPIPDIAASVWQRLPETHDGLEQVAQVYYRCKHVLPVAGSQAAIQLLPRLFFHKLLTVAIVSPTYAEHGPWWTAAGHRVSYVSADELESQIDQFNVVVVVNPNNPDGSLVATPRLRQWQRELTGRAGCLVVDEAFMDATPQLSMASYSGSEGLVVLRSMGKFFGLAGIRLGFVLAWPSLLTQLQILAGPWSVSHVARCIGSRALTDVDWQQKQITFLESSSQRLQKLLANAGLSVTGSTLLFQYVQSGKAQLLQSCLANSGIWIRRFGDTAVRIGLPATEKQWLKLERVLSEYNNKLDNKHVEVL